MTIKIDNPVVFISYAWSSIEHENWVIEFSTRLSHSGVIVKLDKWELAAGQDKNAYMEQMVRDDKIKYVLIICDKTYQEKADERKGGVGTETMIISNEVYNSVEQKKFIPITRGHDSSHKPFLPIYLSSRIYIDFTKKDEFEESLEKLLRTIFDRPLVKKPELGVPPSYLFEDETRSTKSSSDQKQAIHALKSEKPYGAGMVEQYLSGMLQSLDEFAISRVDGEVAFDDKVIGAIKKMNPLRDEFLELIDVVISYYPDYDFEKYIDFFGDLNYYFGPRIGGVSYSEVDFDNFRYFGEELFLSTIGLLIKRGRYKAIESLIYGPYFPKDWQKRPSDDGAGCSFLNQYIKSLEEVRKNRLKSNLISVTSDFMIENTSKLIRSQDLVVAESVLFNATLLNSKMPKFGRDWWYPRTSPYVDHEVDLAFYTKMVSIKHFEKVKNIFRVDSKLKLLEKISKAIGYIEERNFNFGFYSNPPFIQNLVDTNKIASL